MSAATPLAAPVPPGAHSGATWKGRRKKETSQQRRQRRERADMRVFRKLIDAAGKAAIHHNTSCRLVNVLRLYLGSGGTAAADDECMQGNNRSVKEKETAELGVEDEEHETYKQAHEEEQENEQQEADDKENARGVGDGNPPGSHTDGSHIDGSQADGSHSAGESDDELSSEQETVASSQEDEAQRNQRLEELREEAELCIRNIADCQINLLRDLPPERERVVEAELDVLCREAAALARLNQEIQALEHDDASSNGSHTDGSQSDGNHSEGSQGDDNQPATCDGSEDG